MRRNILIALAVFTLSSPAIANEESPLKKCTLVSELAETIMTARQNGVAMARMLEIADGNTLTEGLVMEAYDHPSYSTESVQQRTIRNFADRQMNACMKALRK